MYTSEQVIRKLDAMLREEDRLVVSLNAEVKSGDYLKRIWYVFDHDSKEAYRVKINTQGIAKEDSFKSLDYIELAAAGLINVPSTVSMDRKLFHIGGEHGTKDGTTALEEQTADNREKSYRMRVEMLTQFIRQMQQGRQVSGEAYYALQTILLQASALGLYEMGGTLFPKGGGE